MMQGIGSGFRQWGGWLWVLVVAALSVPAWGQTPDSACAQDSLYLISPDSESLTFALKEAPSRPGLIISWPALDVSQATCVSLSETENLDFVVEVTGGFRDRVDREFQFTAPYAGSVGSPLADQVYLSWGTTDATVTGTIRGEINLANNGGIIQYDAVGGQWSKINSGLPMTMRKTNVLALAEGQGGFLVAAFSGGANVESTPKGVYVNSGTGWTRIRPDLFGSSTLVTKVAVSAANNDHFALGTNSQGLFVTTDGGRTFVQLRSELENPATVPLPANYRVRALDWSTGRLFVAVANFGLFYSTNQGQSFTRSSLLLPEDLDDPASQLSMPSVNSLTSDPANPDRILLCLQFQGIYETLDGGLSWHSLGGDLVVADPGDPGAWVHSAFSVAIDAVDPQLLIGGFSGEGLYRSPDGGVTWTYLSGAPQPANLALLTWMTVINGGVAGSFYALEDGWALLQSNDGGLTWQEFSPHPALRRGRGLLLRPGGSGNLLVATYGGGIYVPGTYIPLHETMIVGTDPGLMGFDLGLSLRFFDGAVAPGDFFKLTCQTYQGWAVWRSPGQDLDTMEMLGMFDLVNPEDCIEGYCGDLNYDPIPRCFASKRAACFDFSTPDTVRFFDEEVYNGFAYNYAVTSFDYGNTAEISVENNTNTRLFSPRWDGDPSSPFHGGGSRTYIMVNTKTEPVDSDEEIYVFPNPLRPGAGIEGFEGRKVRFTNLPGQSRVRIFTAAGDDVVDLGSDLQDGDNIDWHTVNREGEPVAPGVYIFKVEMPEREPYWGRLVIIR